MTTTENKLDRFGRPLYDESVQEILVAAAVRTKEGIILVAEKPGRHHTIINSLKEKHKPYHDQGFMTNTGRYVDREEGGKIAKESGQCTEFISPGVLTSEDLW